MVTVRSHYDLRAVPGEDLGTQGHWPCRKDGVAGLHELFCGILRGCNDHWDLAELEEHERAMGHGGAIGLIGRGGWERWRDQREVQ